VKLGKDPLSYIWIEGVMDRLALEPGHLPLPDHVRKLLLDPARPKPETWKDAKRLWCVVMENSGEYARGLTGDGWFGGHHDYWDDNPDVEHDHPAATAPIPSGRTAKEHVDAVSVCVADLMKLELGQFRHPEYFIDAEEDSAESQDDVLIAKLATGVRYTYQDLGAAWGTGRHTTEKYAARLVKAGRLATDVIARGSLGGKPEKVFFIPESDDDSE
jgi:hypothetical protein